MDTSLNTIEKEILRVQHRVLNSDDLTLDQRLLIANLIGSAVIEIVKLKDH